MGFHTIKTDLYLFRKTIILIASPIILLPLLVLSAEDFFDESACAYTILLMAIYWISEVVPLAVTALLPLVMYPFLGVLPARVVSVQYLKDVNVLFLGGLTVAVAVEHWNLHKRIALKVLTFVGAKPRWLLFGFMVTTAFLSMWISNVATTAMMIPIAQAVLSEMESDSGREDSDSGCNTPEELTPEIGHEGTNTRYHNQDTALVAEMGNIGEAQELGKRLASYDMDEVPQWAHSSMGLDHKHGGSVRYKGATYNPIGNGNIPQNSHSNPQITLNPPQDEDGPDTSTTQLVAVAEKKPHETFQLPDDMTVKNTDKNHEGMCKALTICVCYAANIGGTATLTGTGPNLIMAGQFKTTYSQAPEVDFGSWAIYAFPGMLAFLFIAWLWIQWLFLDISLREMFSCCKRQPKTAEEVIAENVISRQYKELGPMSFAETAVLALFVMLAVLWLTRDPGFIHGWGTLPIFKDGYVTDASVAMLITFILFVFPSKWPNIGRCRQGGDRGPVPALLTWSIVQQKMAWNVILLLGGGFAMALGSKESGLSAWIGDKLRPLNGMEPAGASFICCLVICALTQCTSNTATATVFIPILAELAEILHVNPLYLLLPATVTTSYAFMLPVSTPPNAIAYSYGHLKMMDMVKAGALLNLIGIVVVLLSVYTMGGVSFDVFEPCPDWLLSGYCEELRLNATSATTAFTNVLNVTLANAS